MNAQQAYQLALEHHRAGRLADAETLYRTVIGDHRWHAEAHNNLGTLLKARGELDRAMESYEQAIRLRPDYAEAHSNLGNAFKAQGRIEEAVAAYRRATALRPDFAPAWFNLGKAMREMGKLDEATAAYRQAIAHQPAFAAAYSNLGNVLKDGGQLDEALACFRRAEAIAPDARIASNLLFAIHFHPAYDARRIHEEHVRWNQAYARPLASAIRPHHNDPAPGRRLRIGYVSPDLREHPVGRFLLPLLANRDRSAFEVFCYADIAVSDAITERLMQCADTWRATTGLCDDRLASLVCEDGIDILVDLAMHSDANRMCAFARKPAPVQVTWLAYCSTTGLEGIDYRLSDPHFDPPGVGDAHYSERTIRLPRTVWCYEPPETAPRTRPPPACECGFITFGCFNNFAKVTAPTLAVWRELLRRLDGSRLLIHCAEGSHRRRILDGFAGAGVDPGRVQVFGYLPMAAYLEKYNSIDVALDPFPFCGGRTTCDALWMGVPVVTLAGQTAVSRAGVSILSNLGAPEWIAATPEEYVQIAAGLASDLSRLSEIRSTLRERMGRSRLMDGPRFARDVEAAYRSMWHEWCSRTSGRS